MIKCPKCGADDSQANIIPVKYVERTKGVYFLNICEVEGTKIPEEAIDRVWCVMCNEVFDKGSEQWIKRD